MAQTALETIGISKSYRSHCVVDNLNISVHEGDIYGFLGPNGAGKSTTIRMITGLVRPDSGTVNLLGSNVQHLKHKALVEVGALVESPAFYKYLSARENINILTRLSGGCSQDRINEALNITGLLSRADDNVKTYSQGMRQRLGIAQALLPNPKLVILDEPTNGLDPQGMKDIRDLILHLAKDMKITVVLSSHLLHEVEQICSRVGIINNGKLVAEGYVQDLLSNKINLVNIKVSNVHLAIELINKMDDIEIISFNSNYLTIKLTEDRIADLNRQLVMAGINVTAIIAQNASLEDLFLEMIKSEEANV